MTNAELSARFEQLAANVADLTTRVRVLEDVAFPQAARMREIAELHAKNPTSDCGRANEILVANHHQQLAGASQ